ncbi:MAG: hypothetical protein J5666_05645, partial [Bacilli bacterium]|nr:hypothetical protein [Bacilli bacterium]
LSVHEKENLFPLELMHPKEKAEKEIIKFITRSKPSNENDYRNYYDIKDGILKADACNPSLKCPQWQSVYVPIINLLVSNNWQSKKPNAKRICFGVGDKEVMKQIQKGIDYSAFKSFLTSLQEKDIEAINALILKFGYCYPCLLN